MKLCQGPGTGDAVLCHTPVLLKINQRSQTGGTEDPIDFPGVESKRIQPLL
jgi:hypothetical protein